MARRVLFLISDTGGGHRASAKAIAEGLQRLYGAQVEARLVDLLVDYSPWPLSRAPQLYGLLVDRYQWLWRWFWWAGERPRIWSAVVAAMLAWNRTRLARCFDENPADLVVSVHPLLNHVPWAALRGLERPIPFATVVTDLSTAHPVWYNQQVDLLCASCVEVQRAALAAGIAAERVRLAGLPISLRFGEPVPEPGVLRRQLGLLDRPTVLVVGGGGGMGPVAQITEALAAGLAEQPVQLAVICGRNEYLRRELAGRNWPLPVHVTGFAHDMPHWLHAADCLVTKAGPGTIAEALACGLPMVLSSYVPGQETGNINYVVDNGVGLYCPEPAQIAATVAGWLAPDNPALAAMQQRARALARPDAALEVARALAALLGLR